MLTKYLIVAASLSTFTLSESAAAMPDDTQNTSPTTAYSIAAAKATRFYAQKEWSSALAMYYLMIDERPSDCSNYAKAIAIAGMLKDRQAQERLTKSAFGNRVVVDSLFNGVYTDAITLGRADIYENYLKDVAIYEPWLDRVVSANLLKYYSQRRNGPKTVEYAKKMLLGLPDDVGFMLTLARGYLDCNETAEAENVFKSVLALDADNLPALLYLGNAAIERSDKKAGAEYLRHANELNPTPYLEKVLSGIIPQDHR